MSEQGIIVNKYGAVDAQEIIDLKEELTWQIKRINKIGKILEDMVGIKGESMPRYIYDILISEQLPETFKKMKELTKCDDYEYKTTPETKKLVKKTHKQAKD